MAEGYNALLSTLYALEASKGMDFKLERIASTLCGLGNPHLRYPVIHVAGTNGKGSVAAFLHAILSAQGGSIGLYTSPHLVRFTERIRVGEGEISEDEVVELASLVRRAAAGSGVELTFFEFVTVLAFEYFARRKVSLAVVEVGLGGRLDATNMVHPQVCAITSIGLDHCEFLGDGIESIAGEKAGIIKPGVPLVVGPVPQPAASVIRQAAEAKSASVVWIGRDAWLETSECGLRYVSRDRSLDGLVLGLRGRHQRDNAAVAIAASLQLPRSLQPDDGAIRAGLARVRWPGRLEILGEWPRVIVDGAHNPDSVEALVRELPLLVGDRPVHLVVSMMRDKDWPAMIDRLGPRVTRATATVALPRRGADVVAMAERLSRFVPVDVVEDPIEAVERALAQCSGADALLVTGSLFLVGAVYSTLERRAASSRIVDSVSSALQP